MKLKIYSILLLLSFLAVLSHEMIPHHHHDFDRNVISGCYNHCEHHAYHDSDIHQHHDVENQNHKNSSKSEKEDNHTFPFHHHLSAANDFDCVRVELNRNIAVNLPLSAVLNSFFATSVVKPPEIDFIRFTDIPFIINFAHKPGAIGLRAPPSIA